MGGGSSAKLPPLADRDLSILLSYNLEESHFKAFWHRFVQIDVNLNGVWTVNEVYKLINEPRFSIRAPILDRIFFMGDSHSEGAMVFQDFLVSFASFCALSKEEVLQLLFMIIDGDRNGTCEKEELLEFFSYVPPGSGSMQPLFPVNNKNALDKFRGGNWKSLEFDGMAQLCEKFPYIAYPAYHVQEQFRRMLLGETFWQKLDQDRMVRHGMPRKMRRMQLPGSKQRIEVMPPGRCTMPEFLEYSRRKTKIANGKRVVDEQGTQVQSITTKERDEQIARSPLANMIRNPRCMYHVPYKPAKVAKSNFEAARPELELDDAIAAAGGLPSPAGTSAPASPSAVAIPEASTARGIRDGEDSESSYESSDED